MKLSAISTCALFGGIASLYGIAIALMPVVLGVFERDLSRFTADTQFAKLITTGFGIAQGLSLRTLAVSAFALALFGVIAHLDWRARRSAETAS